MMQLRKVSEKKKILNFIEIEDKPFTYKDVIEHTGVNFKTVQNVLSELIRDSIIRRKAKDGKRIIYIKSRKYQPYIEWDFQPDLLKLRQIYDLLLKNIHLSITEIAPDINLSLEMTYRYLNILIILRAVKRIKHQYYPIAAKLPDHLNKYSYYLERIHKMKYYQATGKRLIKVIRRIEQKKLQEQRSRIICK